MTVKVKHFMRLRLETNLVLFSFSFFLLNSLWAYFLELTTLKYGRKLHLPKSKLKKKTFDLQVSLSLSSFFYLFSLSSCVKVKMSVETEYWISCLRISIQFPLIMSKTREAFWVVWEKLHFWEEGEEGKLLCVGVMIDVQAKLEKSNPFFCLSW